MKKIFIDWCIFKQLLESINAREKIYRSRIQISLFSNFFAGNIQAITISKPYYPLYMTGINDAKDIRMKLPRVLILHMSDGREADDMQAMYKSFPCFEISFS